MSGIGFAGARASGPHLSEDESRRWQFVGYWSEEVVGMPLEGHSGLEQIRVN